MSVDPGWERRILRQEPVGKDPSAFMAGDGELARLIRERDWSQTPLGPIEEWSLSLRMMVSFLLANRFPLLLWWGPEYISIYNDAYRPVLGKKHPWALGAPVRECWSEIWDVLKPLIDAPFGGGQATWMEDLPLEINRHGFVEETHFTVAYSAVPDETAPRGIGGVLATVHEITEKVIAERRVGILRDLGVPVADARTAEGACATAAETLSKYPEDVPFALLYLIGPDDLAYLAGAAGAGIGDPISPSVVKLAGNNELAQKWPFGAVLRTRELLIVEELGSRFDSVPARPWLNPPHAAVIAPIASNKADELAGFLVAGISARLRFDEAYSDFLRLASTQISTAITNARAYEDERRRVEALAEIDRSKTLFFSNVSHEFRTPLTLMLGPLEDALTSPNLPAEERERIEVAHRNSMRLLKLVNSLLDFSRIEAGRAQASFEPADLATLTAEITSNFRSACERAGLRLLVDCPPLAEPVYVDRDMWEKIVLNLLSNAFKFTFEGEIEVRMRAVDGHAGLTVRDTGVGVPAHDIPRIFERFHRIEGQKSRTYEGSGIGLALVQELVKLHGGAIRAESELGRGTTLTVHVPFGSAHLRRERIGPEPGLASTSVRAEAYVEEALRWLPNSSAADMTLVSDDGSLPELRERARVLVADDNADMRAYIQRLLKGRCEVGAVADGRAALDAARERRPDLVLADVMMPGLDGFELLRAIRADPAMSDIPVIMLSARAGEESRVRGLEAGADDYLAKPFSARELLARIESNLKLAKLRRQSEHALRESEEQLRLATEAAEVGLWDVDPINDRLYWPERVKAMFGISADVPVSMADFYAGLHPEDHEQTSTAFAAALDPKRRAVYDVEYRTIGKEDGIVRWVAAKGRGIFCNERCVRVIGTAIDVTARKRDDEHRILLIDELNHRVKNTLAMVQSFATQTLRNASNLAAARATFDARLIALSNAHNILVREQWKGAGLREVVSGALATYCGAVGGSRVRYEGPEIRLQPRAALALSMGLHELGTNAVKYGALSNAHGRIEVSWQVDQEEFRFRWAETGGPRVVAPKKRGFGSRLVEQGLSQDVAGEAELRFGSDGVIWDLRAPITEIRGGLG